MCTMAGIKTQGDGKAEFSLVNVGFLEFFNYILLECRLLYVEYCNYLYLII
jgi:hypothetical protein